MSNPESWKNPISYGTVFNGEKSTEYSQDLIRLFQYANAVNFLSVSKYYGLALDEFNVKTLCPFKFHNDKTASFYYYPETSSFFCFGCKSGGGSLQFVALMEDLSKVEAAKKLLTNFESNNGDPFKLDNTLGERRDLCISFSKMINDFIKKNIDDLEAIKYADNICAVFDEVTQNHHLEIDGLQRLIKKMKHRLEGF